MPSRRLTIAVLAVVVLAVILLLCGVAYAVRGGRDAGLSGEMSPQLVLVSPPAGQLSALSSAPLTILTELPVAGGGRFVAGGSPTNVAQATAVGLSMQTLDNDTSDKVYYFVEKGAGADAEAELRAMGRVVYEDDRQLLLALAARDEAAFLERAAALPPHIELLTNEAVALGAAAQVKAAAAPSAPDPAIARLLAGVTESRLSERMAELSGERSVVVGGKTVTLQTRYTFSAQISNALLYTKEAFAQMGLAAQTVGWRYGKYSGSNLVADVRGEVHPERIWIVGAHLDDRSQTPYTRAPGADDNASGVAAMLAIADAARQMRLRDTVRFVAFTGEEQGMWGSKSYAPALRAAGVQVMGFIDLDMLAYDGNDDRVIELHSGSRQGSVDLANAFAGANERYGTGLVIEIKKETASRFSDHSPFWDAGYNAIMTIENFFVDARPADRNPWYHNTGDSLARARMSYVERYTRAALATVLELAGVLSGPAPTATPTRTATPGRNATRRATQTATPVPAPSSTVTPTAVPSATLTSTPSPTLSPAPVSCRNILLNGDMEGTTGWSFGATARPPAYVASPAASGAAGPQPCATGCLRTGIVAPTTDRSVYSSAYQRVAIPKEATSAVFTAQVWRGTTDSSGDRQEVLLLNTRFGALRTIQRGLGSDSAWQTVRFDLASFAGQTVVVYFNTYNDGDGRRSWMYVDEARVEVCTR